jgi:hypothetical protein
LRVVIPWRVVVPVSTSHIAVRHSPTIIPTPHLMTTRQEVSHGVTRVCASPAANAGEAPMTCTVMTCDYG